MKHDSHKSWLRRLLHCLHRYPDDKSALISVLKEAKNRQLLDNEALGMMQGVLKVSEMQVRDIMVPRPQMVVIEHDNTPRQALPSIIESTHSRFPVIGESRDEILGILLAKDLLPVALNDHQTHTTIETLVRPAVFIPESKRLNILLKELRLNRNHMAIVIDEYGGVAGLITIEDVLEQIVGDIEDETDITEQEPNIKQLTNNEYTIKALTPITEFNQYFKTNINDEDFDTIGGYVTQQFGYLPKRGESIMLDHLQISIIAATKRRIQLLRLCQANHAEN